MENLLLELKKEKFLNFDFNLFFQNNFINFEINIYFIYLFYSKKNINIFKKILIIEIYYIQKKYESI